MDVKTTCLGVLVMGNATGYEIRKAFEYGPFAHFADGGFGSIYPAIAKAESPGMVTCKKHKQQKRPAKKIYAITDMGREHLFSTLKKDPGEDKFRSNFLFALYYADALPAEWIDEIITKRIADYKQKIECLVNINNQYCDDKNIAPTLIRHKGIEYYKAMLGIISNKKDKFIAAAIDNRNNNIKQP